MSVTGRQALMQWMSFGALPIYIQLLVTGAAIASFCFGLMVGYILGKW